MRPYNVAPLPRYSTCRMGCNLLQWPAEHTYGVLAHLVERFHGMEEVGGSNPPYSTIIARLTALGYKPKAVLYGIWYGALRHTRITAHRAQLQATIQHAQLHLC